MRIFGDPGYVNELENVGLAELSARSTSITQANHRFPSDCCSVTLGPLFRSIVSSDSEETGFSLTLINNREELM